MAASYDKTIQPRLWREGKHADQTAPVGNAPLSPLRGTSPRESVSRDFQVAALPYKSRSLATPEGEVLTMLRSA